VVKVLDFGLAKYDAGDNDASLTQSPTSTGTQGALILGTAAYMSPEQARGKPVDKRTDIWAFGCVFYEMLAGRAAFAGETLSDIIAAILEREPSWSALPADLPKNLDTLLRRCLEKDAKRRLRDIGDARIELEDAGKGPVGPSAAAPSVIRQSAWRRYAPAAAILAGLAGVLYGFWPRTASSNAFDPLAGARFTRFTDFPGTETLASISPDGKFVAFLSDRDGRFDLWVSQVGTGRFTNLTKDGLSPAPNYIVRPLGFTGDGSEVWLDVGGRRQLIPLTGGAGRPFLGPTTRPQAWSPNGAQLVYFNVTDGDPMFVADRTGGNPRQISRDPAGVHNHNLVWSTDGEWIYFVHGLDVADQMDIWRIRPAGGAAERMTQHRASITFLAPLNAHTVLFVAKAEDRSGPWLWALDVDRKVERRVSAGLEQYTSVAASGDGRRVIATVANPQANLWSVPILDRLANDGDVTAMSVPSVRAVSPRFRGADLFYLSARGAGDGLWRLHNGDLSEVWQGSDGALAEPSSISPDGRRAAIVVRKDGKRRVLLVSTDGSESRTLSTMLDAQGSSDWSPDGSWLATGGDDGQGPGLFKVAVDGGTLVRLANGVATNPVWSPDGNLIVFAGATTGGRVPLLGVRPDGTAVDLPPMQTPTSVSQAHRFLPKGLALVYVQTDAPPGSSAPGHDLWLMDLTTKIKRQVARLTDSGEMGTFDVSPDGKRVVFDRLHENSDLVLIDLPAR